MPVSVNRNLGANDRCSPNGPVISAFLSAVIEDDTIAGWLEYSAFSVQDVHPEGSLAESDLAAARLAVNAGGADAGAGRLGAIGIASRIAKRRAQEHNTGHLPLEFARSRARARGDSNPGQASRSSRCRCPIDGLLITAQGWFPSG